MKETPGYRNLLNKLDVFIRKYYLNQILRGVLLWIALVFLLYLLINVLEFQFWFETGIRKVLFYGFIAIAIISGIFWIGIPGLKYLKLGKRISNTQAAHIIGNHFSSVQDKLLNVLQLKNQVDNTRDNSLLLASIEQKTENIQVVNFPRAIDLTQNKKYLKYVIPPIAILLLLIIAAPNIITKSTNRLINNDIEYEKPAPFNFHLQQERLKVVQFSDINLDVTVEGKYFPEQVEILVDGYPYKMRKSSPNEFHHQLKNIQADKTIQFQAGAVKSRPYTIEVIGKPSIKSFLVQLDYPYYVGKRDEILKNTGDIIVPEGTKLNWIFSTVNTDALGYSVSDDKIDTITEATHSPNIRGEFTLENRALKNHSMTFYVSGNGLENADSVTYDISTIPDNYPVIQIKTFRDSALISPIYVVGEASDDYGISSLYFKYFIVDAEGRKGEMQSRKVKIDKGTKIAFEDVFHVENIVLEPGEQLNYYYQVFDNDGVNGHKSSRTPMMTIKKPSLEEYQHMEEKNEESILANLEKAFRKNEELKKRIHDLRNKLLFQNDVSWQDKKTLEELMKMQKKIQEKIEEALKKYKENLKNQKEFNKPEEDIREKQEQLKKLFEKAEEKSDIQKMLEKLQKLMQKLNKEKSLQMLEKMKDQQSEQNMDLDRLKELFKQLELERDLQQQFDKLNKLADKQEKVQEKTAEKNPEKEKSLSQEELEKKQKEINKKFQEIKEAMNKIVKRNNKLLRPKDIGNPKRDMYMIQKDLNESLENLNKNQNSKAAQKMQDAAQKMRKMSEQMQSKMKGGSAKAMQADLESLRQLLENLVGISFDQEALINKFNRTSPHTQLYVKYLKEQFKVKEDFAMVEDSLRALSKRVFSLKPFIMEKVTDINEDMEKSLAFLEERKVPVASNHQQRVMKSVNDLAVMLSETMEQMQKQMAKKMPGSQMCDKPGASNPGSSGKQLMNKITQGQKKLSEKMKKMAQEKKGKSGKGGMSSEDFAKLARQQAAMRRMLEKYNQSMHEKGQGVKALQEIIKQMNQTEESLVNKRLTSEMIRRQQDIITRLLQAKDAMRQQKMSPKRKAETAKNIKQKEVPPALAEYLQKRRNEIEVLKSVSPSLQPFYKELVNEYYQSLGN